MKKVLTDWGFWISVATITLIAVVCARATTFPLANRGDTVNVTLLTASGTTTTNVVGTSYFVEKPSYHTIHILNTGGSSQGCAIDRALDSSGTNWIVVSTNVVAAGGVGEVTMTGHWSYVRARQLGTNDSMTVFYLGGN